MCIGCEQIKAELKWACYQNVSTKTLCHACTIKLAVTSIHSVLERYTLPNDFMPVFCPHCCSLRWKGEKCHGEPVLSQGHFPAETITVCGQPDCGELKTRHNLGQHLKECHATTVDAMVALRKAGMVIQGLPPLFMSLAPSWYPPLHFLRGQVASYFTDAQAGGILPADQGLYIIFNKDQIVLSQFHSVLHCSTLHSLMMTFDIDNVTLF